MTTIKSEHKKAPTWWQDIKTAVYDHYQGIVNKIKSPFAGLLNYFKQDVNKDSAKLLGLREKHYKLIQEEGLKTNPDYPSITRLISADTKQYIQEMLDDEIKKLGKPPCKFSVVTLGSMAREECGPVTDLEIGFLIEEKTVENYKYFHQLSQKLSDRLFLLGEHPDIGGKGLRMDEADNAPPHRRFWARNLSIEEAQKLQNEAIAKRDWKQMPYEGSRPYLTTYNEFATFSKPVYEQDRLFQRELAHKAFEQEWEKAKNDPKNKDKLKTKEGVLALRREIGYWVNQMHSPYNNRELNIANTAGKKLGRNMALLYGDKAHFDDFMSKKEAIFAQTDNKKHLDGRQVIAKDKMQDDIMELLQKGKSPYVTGKLDKTLDIKRDFYRFMEQFVTNLGFYHHCKSQNSLDIIQELSEKEILSTDLTAKMKDFIQFTTGLRLKEQAVLKRQGFATYIDEAEFADDKTKLEKEINNLEASIQYMASVQNPPQDTVNLKKRALVELKDKYHHMLEMAPGKLISENDLTLLKSKYVPMAHEMFQHAQKWTQGEEKLGFAQTPAPAPLANQAQDLAKPAATFLPAMEMHKLNQDAFTRKLGLLEMIGMKIGLRPGSSPAA